MSPKEKPTVGGADLNPPGHAVEDVNTEGMLIGPDNPIFNNPPSNPPNPSNTPNTPNPLPNPSNPLTPHLPSIPPGARYDPISPIDDTASGDPDFDEFLPPGLERGRGRGRGLRGRGRGNERGAFGNGFDIKGNPFGGSGSGSGFNPFGGL